MPIEPPTKLRVRDHAKFNFRHFAIQIEPFCGVKQAAWLELGDQLQFEVTLLCTE